MRGQFQFHACRDRVFVLLTVITAVWAVGATVAGHVTGDSMEPAVQNRHLCFHARI
jgi:hypothetical protein